METVNLDQLAVGNDGTYLLGDVRFSGFAIETFPDGSLATQMAFMHGRQDGVTRRWHPNGQLQSEESFRDGAAHGWHREWRPDGLLLMQSTWNAGKPVAEWRFDEQGRLIQKIQFLPPDHPAPVTFQYDDAGSAV